MANNTQQFQYGISGQTRSSSIKSIDFFDQMYTEPESSPIDIFNNKKTSNIKLLGSALYDTSTSTFTPLASSNNEEWQQLSNLSILGFVSAVETYFRGIIRKMLVIDKHSRQISYKHAVTYGAALYHEKNMLPEALLEGASFHCAKNIKESINKFLDIQLNEQSNSELSSVFENYDIVGHLRHCVVHRAGLLGSKNALALGLDEHHSFMEKPINIDLASIQEVGFVCDNLIKTVNDALFQKTLCRSIKTIDWSGDFDDDKENFSRYFNLFSPLINRNEIKMKACYDVFAIALNLN